MWKKIAISGAVAAAIVGAGTASVALTSPDTVAGTATNSSAAPAPGSGEAGSLPRHLGRHPLAKLGNVLHGQWVTKNDKGEVVTHNEIHGVVMSVSTTSITVKASDGVTQTYAVTSDTKVRQHTKGERRGAASEIGKVKNGDNVVVSGTGTSTLTAKLIIDILEK